MAWIEKRSGNYRVMWREADGTKRSKTVPTRAEARTVKAEIETELARGTYVAQDRREEPFIEYLQAVYAGDLTIREVTRAKYEGVIRLHLAPRLGRVGVGDLQASELRRLFADLAAEAGPWNAWEAFKITRRAVRQALAEGLLSRDPLAGVKVAAPRRKGVRILTPAEVGAIADAIVPELRAAVLVSAYGGLRIGEIGALVPEDLEGDVLTVRRSVSTPRGRTEVGPPKGAGERRVTLPSWVAQEFREHILRTEGPLFPYTHLNIRRPWQAACEAAGVEARFHDLRHTAVALLIQQGAHPKLIQARMGHSSITMTMGTYGHLFPTADAELAASLEQFAPKEAKVVNLHERDDRAGAQ